MLMVQPVNPPVKAVVFDLDGTIIDTETLVLEVARTVVERHGKQLTAAAAACAVGMRPLDAWQAVIDELALEGVTAEQLFAETEPLLTQRWHEAPLLPGVQRLLAHLRATGVPLALATSSSRATLARKLSTKPEVLEAFSVPPVCGDECCRGKPHPECFFEAAKRLGVEPSECLVIEDAPSGIEAAAAAGMRVVAVPSTLHADGTLPGVYPAPDPAAASGCVSVLPSLFDFKPQHFGLQPFTDVISGAVPMDVVWRLQGKVVAGFGRGSKRVGVGALRHVACSQQLGIPTANLDPDSLRGTLAQASPACAVTGIYAGWASVGSSPAVYKMCMSIGWNPVFADKQKTAEPWLLHTFEQDFHGEHIRLVICAWLRPEANFDSVDSLVRQIHADADVARAALEAEPLASFRDDPFLLPTEEAAVQAVEPAGG